jgi:hypothetical protein
MSKTIVVSHLQVESAKAVIELAGGPDKVDPLIVKIAAAKPRKHSSDADRSA